MDRNHAPTVVRVRVTIVPVEVEHSRIRPATIATTPREEWVVTVHEVRVIRIFDLSPANPS